MLKNKPTTSRRDFIVKSLTAISAVYFIPDIITKAESAKPLAQEVTSDTKWAMSIDVDKCAKGCTACVDACVEENGLYGFDRPETDSQWIRKLTIKNIKDDRAWIHLPEYCVDVPMAATEIAGHMPDEEIEVLLDQIQPRKGRLQARKARV